MNKLTLSQLKVKSFIIEQEGSFQITIKAGAVGSDGPPHTSSRHTEISCNGVLRSYNCVETAFCDLITKDKTCVKT